MISVLPTHSLKEDIINIEIDTDGPGKRKTAELIIMKEQWEKRHPDWACLSSIHLYESHSKMIGFGGISGEGSSQFLQKKNPIRPEFDTARC